MAGGSGDYCRLCADSKSDSELVSIRARSRPDIENVLVDVFRIDLFADNSALPRTVCTKCIDNVRMIGKFRKKVAKSQQTLSSIFDDKLQEMKTEIVLNESDELEESNGQSRTSLSDSTDNGVGDTNGSDDNDDGQDMEHFHDRDSEPEVEIKERLDENDEYKSPVSKKLRKRRKKVDLEEEITDLSNFVDVEVNEEDQSLRLSLDDNVWESYPWKCVACTKIFDSITKLHEHYKSVHGVVNIEQGIKYSCYDCPKVYLKFYSFKFHVAMHRSYLKFGCDICGKFFQNRRALVVHRGDAHKELLKFQCAECGKWFNTKTYLQTHQNVHLPEDQKSKFECNQCQKVFWTKNGLTAHIQTHNGIREYVCEHCGKDFLRKAGLEEHLQTHSDERPFKCEACGRTFKSNVILKLHFQIHTGYKKHECDVCGRKYRKKCSLHQHYRIHTGDMPFTCEFCGKSFRFKGVYQTHRYTHTGERPYSCSECQHFFTNWPNYNKHMKRKHGIDKSNRVKDNLPPSDGTSNAQKNTLSLVSNDEAMITSPASTNDNIVMPEKHEYLDHHRRHHPSIIKIYEDDETHIEAITAITNGNDSDGYFRVWN